MFIPIQPNSDKNVERPREPIASGMKEDDEEENLVKCGCGLGYKSRSALNVHVKRKHNGGYPEGTDLNLTVRIRPGKKAEGGRNGDDVFEESES